MKKTAYMMALMNKAKDRTIVMVDFAYPIKDTLKANGYTYDGDTQMWYKVIEHSAMDEYQAISAQIDTTTTVLETVRVAKSGHAAECRELKARILGE